MPTTTDGKGPADGREEGRLYPIIDRWFVGLLVLELVAFASVPVLPLGLAVAGFATPVRGSRWRMGVLLGFGVLLSLIVVAPFILNQFGVQTVDEGPVHTVG